MATVTLQKALGAFYTDEPAARRLVEWAVCDPSARVLDPSCGDGVFLAVAHSRLAQLGCKAPKVHGIDVSVDALRFSHQRVEGARLDNDDFFNLTPELLGRFDAIVGNPPFIRYQTFNGHKESLGHRRAKEAGVDLPRLASSWAPFVVHASQFLRAGGAALVMPSELGHAMYAREVLRFLVGNFRHVAVEMFRDKLFGDLSQSTVLLFCEGYGEQSRTFLVSSSSNLSGADRQVAKADLEAVRNGRFRFTHYLISESARDLYRNLTTEPRVQALGEIADVGIGYVTGANDFFHLSVDDCQKWEIPKRYLRPCVLNLRGFKDIEYTLDYWKTKREQGGKSYLLTLPSVPVKSLPSGVQTYIRHGEASQLADRYKCRIREFWYVVPHIRIADAFLSYMSGEQPLLVTNAANLVAPNTVHVLRFVRGVQPLSYAASWRSSLTRLSCELEGHALGGGLFKLEPSEAERVLLIRPSAGLSSSLVERFRRHRGSSLEQAGSIADKFLLRRQMGLNAAECQVLKDAALKLESWRKHK